MWAWLRKSLGMPLANTPSVASNLGQGGFNFEVVGEQSYQNHLRRVSAGRAERGDRVTFPCRLRYEINPHTHGPAVRVETIDGRTLGHFPRAQAEVYADAFQKLEQSGRVGECQGVLVGGQPDKPSLGVWLDFKPKLLALHNR
jgi:hypothetical protein